MPLPDRAAVSAEAADRSGAPEQRPRRGVDGPGDARGVVRAGRLRAGLVRLRRVRGRDVARLALAALLVLVPSAAFGVATASADGSLGPHVARYEVTLDHRITVDVGPLGTLVLDSPLPLTLGARVTVREIPREVTALEGFTTVEALSRDLEQYVQFFSAPRATVDVAVRALVADAVRRAVLSAVLLTGLAVGLRALLGPARRREVAAVVGRHRPALVGGGALTLVLLVVVTSSSRLPPATPSVPASPVFDGTALEGVRITGRLAGVLDTYGAQVVEAYRDNERFYGEATANLEVAWAERAALDAELDRARAALLDPQATRTVPTPEPTLVPGPTATRATASPDAAPDAQSPVPGAGAGTSDGPVVEEGSDVADPAVSDPIASDPTASDPTVADPPTSGPADEVGAGTADAASGQVADAADEPSEEPAPTTPREEPVVLLVVSDLHCNVGMAPVIRTAAELSGASVILNGGDSTVNGTAVESYCVEAFGQAVPDGATMVVADGNHDSAETSEQERAAGMRVLDGEVVEVAGVRILGDADPRATRIGTGTTLVGEETPGEAAARLADVACGTEVDLLLVHDARLGSAAAEQGCVPAQVSGHQHRRIGPTRSGGTVVYVNASTAGAALGRPTVGPLQGVAELTVLRFDPGSRSLLDYRLVTVRPDASVAVGPAVRWPGGPLEPEREPVAPDRAR